jgi:hypothetical protein
MADRYTQEEVTQFYRAADSLRKYRRAELVDDQTGSSVLTELYCDPLPHNGLSTRVGSANTTLIIGRKGTGKSTVFQRLQHDIRQTNDRLTAYIDINTIWDSSQVSLELQERIAQMQYALPPATVERMLLYRAFLKSVVEEIQRELDKKLAGSMWERIKNAFSGRLDHLKGELAAFVENYTDDNFIRVLGLKAVGVKEQDGSKTQTGANFEASGEGAASGLKLGGKLGYSKNEESTHGEEAQFTDILANVFDPGLLIKKLKGLLTQAGIRHVFLLIDDFSELPLEAMRVVVNVLLAPMNNLSDEFIKLKIAAYPGRIYLGAIDRTKIDEVYLDLYKLYGAADITKLEESGIDFTRRLVTQRLVHFCKGEPTRFFERNFDEVIRQLFNASLCNPRILGHVLVYLHESHIATGRLIGLRAVGDAAHRFYEEKVESFFQTGRFLQEAFDERSSIFSLKELLESFVQRAKELRRHNSAVFLKIEGVPPTSHFYLPAQNEALLTTLELNFFLTKYFEMSDREGNKVSIFALNYGLCEKYSINFGRPVGEREFRLYFVERVFDYSPLVLAYLRNNQEIVCDACSTRYEYADVEKLQFFGMRCPKCQTGTCRVTNLSRKYEAELNAVRSELLLPKTELGILQTLDVADEPLRAGEIAEELDCSYQLVGRRARNLEERKLVSRDLGEDGRRQFALTDLARNSYFDPAISSDLKVDGSS